MDVAVVRLGNRGTHTLWPTQERPHLLGPGHELHLLQCCNVVGVRRHYRQNAGFGVVHDGKDSVLISQFLRHLLECRAFDIGPRQFLRRNEPRAVVGGEVLQKLCFLDGRHIEQSLLHPLTELRRTEGGLPLLGADESLIDHLVQQTDVARRMHGVRLARPRAALCASHRGPLRTTRKYYRMPARQRSRAATSCSRDNRPADRAAAPVVSLDGILVTGY